MTRCEGCRRKATALYKLPISGGVVYLCEIHAERFPGIQPIAFIAR